MKNKTRPNPHLMLKCLKVMCTHLCGYLQLFGSMWMKSCHLHRVCKCRQPPAVTSTYTMSVEAKENKALPEPVTQNVIFAVPELTWLLMAAAIIMFSNSTIFPPCIHVCGALCTCIGQWNIYAFLRFSYKYNWFYDGHNTTKTNKIKHTSHT